SDLRSRGGVGPPHLGRTHRTPQEYAHLEVPGLRTDEEITRAAREHDRMVRRVNPLLAQLRRRCAEALPGLAQIFGQVTGQCPLGSGPAVMRLPFLNRLLAVVTLATGH